MDVKSKVCFLSERELALVDEALDALVYWELSESETRHSGEVVGLQSDEQREKGIREARQLRHRLFFGQAMSDEEYEAIYDPL